MARLTPTLTCLMTFCFVAPLFADATAAGADGLSDEIRSLVENLDSPDWRTRDQATQDLMNADPIWLEALRRKSQSGLTTEARLRLKRAAEELFFTSRIGPAPACLGIGHTIAVRPSKDPRVAPGVHAIRINVVYDNSPADRAGLRPGDLIIGTNGVIATSEDAIMQFTGWISGHRPGARCEFNVLRNIEGRVISTGPGIDRRGFRNLETRVIDGSGDVRLPVGGVGLLVTNARRADPRLGLEPGDMIVAIDGKPLPREDPQQALAKWADFKSPGVDPNLAVMSSVHVIRGGHRIDLTATLGRWPLDLAQKVREIKRGASPERIGELRSEFDGWWNHVDGATSASDVAMRHPSLFWQMDG